MKGLIQKSNSKYEIPIPYFTHKEIRLCTIHTEKLRTRQLLRGNLALRPRYALLHISPQFRTDHIYTTPCALKQFSVIWEEGFFKTKLCVRLMSV